MLILLADDERMARFTIKSMVDQLFPGEHEFIEVQNGLDAEKALIEYMPDLAFIDYKMPYKNGAEIIEGYYGNAVLVLISGHDLTDMTKMSECGNLYECIEKPIDPLKLKRIVTQLESAKKPSGAES